jgi:hypothetical protein
MTDRPGPIRFDDLEHPRFTPDAQAIMDAIASAAPLIRLESEVMRADAMAQTGLSDFAEDPEFAERLELLAWCFREEDNLNAAGKVQAYSMLVSQLVNRLLIADLLAEHPEIHDIEITAPIIICGQPRTGTTHLHNLMSADPALRTMPYWESLQPALPRAERGLVPDPRLERTAASIGFINTCMPDFKRMHEMTVEHIHEEIQLLAIDLSTQLYETMGLFPTLQAYYRSHDQTGSYEYMKTVLKVLQWYRGGDRWVIKSPQHLEQFAVLASVFPDATFVVTHRDPVSVTKSVGTMIAYGGRLRYDTVPTHAIGRYWADRAAVMCDRCVADRELLPADRSIDVFFDEFMADDVATVERIYQLAGQPFTGAVRAAMDEFMVHNPRGRHGAVLYDLDQLGLNYDEVLERNRAYVERFGVSLETP